MGFEEEIDPRIWTNGYGICAHLFEDFIKKQYLKGLEKAVEKLEKKFKQAKSELQQ